MDLFPFAYKALIFHSETGAHSLKTKRQAWQWRQPLLLLLKPCSLSRGIFRFCPPRYISEVLRFPPKGSPHAVNNTHTITSYSLSHTPVKITHMLRDTICTIYKCVFKRAWMNLLCVRIAQFSMCRWQRHITHKNRWVSHWCGWRVT